MNSTDIVNEISLYASKIPKENQMYILGYGKGLVDSSIKRKQLEVEKAKRILQEVGEIK